MQRAARRARVGKCACGGKASSGVSLTSAVRCQPWQRRQPNATKESELSERVGQEDCQYEAFFFLPVHEPGKPARRPRRQYASRGSSSRCSVRGCVVAEVGVGKVDPGR